MRINKFDDPPWETPENNEAYTFHDDEYDGTVYTMEPCI